MMLISKAAASLLTALGAAPLLTDRQGALRAYVPDA